MIATRSDHLFAGSIPQLYEQYLVPLIFEPYARDIAERLAARPPARILEVAAGTGVVTRAMAAALPASCAIVATDLNAPMIDHARTLGTRRAVEWRQADALELPFADASFDAVVCQFGVMFFPDRRAGFAEARRVLRRGGRLLFNVWDRIEANEFADEVTRALASIFPQDPPRFLARTPHGYYDKDVIHQDLAAAGFAARPEIDTLEARSRALSCSVPAVAYCQGTPLRNEIEARDPARLAQVTGAAAEAIGRRFRRQSLDAKIQALVVSVEA